MTTLKTDTSIKNKKVAFDASSIESPDAEQKEKIKATKDFMEKAVLKNKKDLGKGSPERIAINNIGSAFTQYLDNIMALDKEHKAENFPSFLRNSKGQTMPRSVDKRMLIVVALLNNLSEKKSTLPSKYSKCTIDFNTKGWPIVESEHAAPYVLAWQQFVDAAASAFVSALPDADLSVWTGKRLDYANSESDSNSSSDSDTESVALDDEQPEFLVISVKPEEHDKLIEPQHYDFNEWLAPKKLSTLINQLKEMYHYGDSIKYKAPEKSEVVMDLAIQLFKSLKDHYKNGSNLDRNKHEDFEFNFKQALHSQDDLMGKHREYWKVVVANIAFSFTVIGALAVGISLLTRKHGFFDKTKSQRLVDELHDEINKSIPIK